ncbi:ArsS family sensor histidine kinase [Sulfurimonas sp. HSL-1656]|uniref:ArsS family sensor histidine kinase n=1 Tax=Thiomicrolovo subterrani TaxID=3131934 RepID=UPI0031F87693
MPRRSSIFFKLNLFFLLALVTLALLFALFHVTASHMETRREVLRGMELARLLHHLRSTDRAERTSALAEAQFALLTPDALPKNARELQPPRNADDHDAREHRERPPLRLYEADGSYYFRSTLRRDPFLVKDERPAENFGGLQLIFVFLLAGLVTLYVLLRRSLLPLRDLHTQIRRFGRGDLDIDTSSTRRDEIAAIANEFNDALEQLRQLRASRQLFLRNVMHELKTPLTKGKLSLAMMEENEQTAYLNRLFSRMDDLINGVAQIEKLQSVGLDRTPQKAAALLETAVNQLYLSAERRQALRITADPDVSIDADAPLFVSALCNLLDNALKYSSELPVTVTADREGICIANKGAPLDVPLDTIMQPFSSANPAGGLGLGLSITDTVMQAHGFTLDYDYREGTHRFCIRFAPSAA